MGLAKVYWYYKDLWDLGNVCCRSNCKLKCYNRKWPLAHLFWLLPKALISKIKNNVGFLVHIVNVDLTFLWHMSYEIGYLEMPAGTFRCHGWTVSSENQTLLTLTLQPFMLCWSDYQGNREYHALKYKKSNCFLPASVVIKIWVGWFSSPAIARFSHITASQPQQASGFEEEASQHPLKQWVDQGQ